MEKNVRCLDTSGKVYHKDMQVTVSNVKNWEIDPIDDVTMSDITRTVNAYTTVPTSSTHGRVFPKREPDEDLNEEITLTSIALLGLPTIPFIHREVIVCKDSAWGTSTTSDNSKTTSDSQKNAHEEGVVQISKNLPKSVEGLSLSTNSALKGVELGEKRSCRPKFPCPAICPIKECSKKLSSKRALDRHVNEHHKETGFQCSKCPQRYAHLNQFEQHDNVHTGKKPYSCDVCGEKFHTHSHAYHHRILKHLGPMNNSLCEFCGVVGNKAFILTHTKTVHLKRLYKCTKCPAGFKFLRRLKDHMRMHRGEDPYTCQHCAKTFVLKDRLTTHMSNHAKQFKCPKCDKVFKTKVFLEGHLLQHEGIKKFCCKVCRKTFHHAHYLISHMKSHEEKRFECAICDGKFSRKDNLKSHIIRHQTTGRKNLKKR